VLLLSARGSRENRARAGRGILPWIMVKWLMKRSRLRDLESRLFEIIEKSSTSMTSQILAMKTGSNVEQVRLALMDLSTEKKIKRSGSGCYRVLPPEMHTEHR